MTNPTNPNTPPTSRLAAFRRPAAPAGAATAPGQPAAPEAAAEQGAPKGLFARIKDAGVERRASEYNPAGEHGGTIISAKLTKSQNGIQVLVKHEDGETLGSLNFNLFTVVKDPAGQPIMDQATGLLKTQASIGAWKQWTTFCERYGVDPSEAADLVEQNRFAETGITQITERWKWTQSGNFWNVSMPLGEPPQAAA